MIIPIVMVLGYSFLDNVILNKAPEFVGLDNFVAILSDGAFFNAIGNTLIFTLTSVAAHLVLGLTFAMLLNSHAHRRRFTSHLPRPLHPAVAVHGRRHRRSLADAARTERCHQLPPQYRHRVARVAAARARRP